MKDICQKYALNINKEFDKLYFLYEGEEINFELTFNEQAKENDKKTFKMNIEVFKNEDYNNYENKKYITSKDITCPKCGEMFPLSIRDDNNYFHEYKNKDKTNNNLLYEYENLQKVWQSKKICDVCKNTNNEIFNCLSCNINLCPLCQLKHDKKHSIINYEDKFYICKS